MGGKHIAMVSIPAPGHVNPSSAVIGHLVAAGHRVTYANDESMRSIVEATGAALVPYVSTLPSLVPGADGAKPSKTWDGDLIDQLTLFQDDYESMLPQLRQAYDGDRPDLFLYDIAGMPARILARQWDVPIVQLSPTYVAWDGYEADTAAVYDGIRADPRGSGLLDREHRFLREEGIEDDPREFMSRPPRAIVLIAESMQPNVDRVDRDIYSFVGPALDCGSQTWIHPDPQRKLLLISLGSAFTAQTNFYRRCIEAFGVLDDWYVVLQIGKHVDVEELGTLPENIEIHRWVPQFAILQKADAFLTHAGMGGSSEGLVTGTPMIAVPQAADQFANADSLVDAGVAVRMDSETVTALELRDALVAVTSDAVRSRSRVIAAELAAVGGTTRAVELIEEALAGNSKRPRS
ncbi:MGT family glycosyltransferase [Rhodococcus sp. 27YEA15]|uniref:macrolide family glycosyltransferase n=1 Tax=Rhodococcus sp. 27YEA15 TaxID=3156259 RepID=UPI003C7CB3A2